LAAVTSKQVVARVRKVKDQITDMTNELAFFLPPLAFDLRALVTGSGKGVFFETKLIIN
jgi:hypothetical protein